MIDCIVNIYKIGKELGLTNKEIFSLFFFKKSKHETFSIFLRVFLIIITVSFLSFLIVLSYIYVEKNTYPAGTKYSTVKIGDFRLKKDIL